MKKAIYPKSFDDALMQIFLVSAALHVDESALARGRVM